MSRLIRRWFVIVGCLLSLASIPRELAVPVAHAVGFDSVDSGPPAPSTAPPGIVGTAIDNSARLEFRRPIDADSVAFLTVSDTVRVTVELASHIEVTPDLETRFVRPGDSVLLIQRVRNLANGVDTLSFTIDSAVALSSVRMFLDADADSLLTESDPAAERVVLLPGGETNVLVLVRVLNSALDQSRDTIFIIYRSVVDPTPLTDTWQIGLTVDAAPPQEAVPDSPPDGATLRDTTPTLIWGPSTDSGAGLSIYIVEISSADCAFTEIIRSARVTDTRWVVTPPLPAGVYDWRVRAVDNLGISAAGAFVRTFSIDTSPLDTGTPGRLFVSPSSRQPAEPSVQERDTQVVAVFSLSADAREAVDVRLIRVTHLGGMPSTSVARMLIYRDAGLTGALDPSDALYFVSSGSSMFVNVSGSPLRIPAGDTVDVLIVYQTGDALNETDTFQVRIDAPSDIIAIGDISDSIPAISGLPATSKTVSVRARYPSVILANPSPHCPYELPPQVEAGLLPILLRFNVPVDPASVTPRTIQLLEAIGHVPHSAAAYRNGTQVATRPDDGGDTGAAPRALTGFIDRTDSVILVDSRTVEIKATYPDTQWPYGKAFTIRVDTAIRDLDSPPDRIQSEFIHPFQMFLDPRAEQTCVSADGVAELRFDTGDIAPDIKGIVVTIRQATPSDTQVAKVLDAMKDLPYLAFIPGQSPIYEFTVFKRGHHCEDGLSELIEADYQDPLEVAISVPKPEFQVIKGTPLNAKMMRMVHIKDNPGEWELLPSCDMKENGDTVTLCARTRSFSHYGVLFAFAPSSVRETFRAFPNPADPFATYTNPSGSWQGFRFGWNMPKTGTVTIRIYDFAGQSVRVIGPTSYAAGDYFAQLGATWDGRNGLGQTVLNGIYFVRAEIHYADGTVEHATDKIAVVK